MWPSHPSTIIPEPPFVAVPLTTDTDVQPPERSTPWDRAAHLWSEIPGIGRRIAEQLVAEIGTGMTRFPSAAHLASWAKLCPSNQESAGRRLSGKTGHSDRGSQYASSDEQARLTTAHSTPSMSRKGNGWDNAPRESFFASSTLKWVCQYASRTPQHEAR